MDAYINDLIQTLKSMAQNPKPVPDYALLNPNHPAHQFEGLEAIIAIECAPYIKVSELFELPVETFPPSNKLNLKQQKQLLQVAETLLMSYGVCVEYPENMPSSKRYDKIREFWESQEMQHLNQGMMHFDGCSGVPAHCFWGKEYCACTKYYN